jgi:flagellar biosynthesis protein FlhG
MTTMHTHKPIILSITSGKGGVGKTSVAVNSAFALANKGYRVLLVDGDLGLANADILLGITAQTTIRTILDGEANPLDAVVYLNPNLGVLPASSGVPEMVSLGRDQQERLTALFSIITDQFDYVLVDTAAGIGSSVLWLNQFAQFNVIVLTPDPTSLTDAYAIIKTLFTQFNRTLFYVVLNLIRDEKEGRRAYETLKGVANQFLDLDLQYLGAIPEDVSVKKAVREQMPFIQKDPACAAAKAVSMLVDQMESITAMD